MPLNDLLCDIVKNGLNERLPWLSQTSVVYIETVCCGTSLFS